MHRWIVRLVLGLAALWAGGAQLALVRADVTMGVAPSLVEVRATPGGQGSQQLVVYNQGSDPFRVVATIEPYKQAADVHSAVDWLNVDPESFELGPGEQQAVTVTITVPSSLPTGGRYAMAAFKTGPAQLAGGNTAVAGQLGVPFLITVDGAGTLRRQAELKQLVPVLEADGRIGFRALLANRGNLHLVPRGGAVEVSRGGASAGRLEVLPSTAILPETEELLGVDGSLPLEEGAEYHAQATLEYGGEAPTAAGVTFTPRSALRLLEPTVRENFDRGPTVLLGLANDGGLGLLPRPQLAIRDADGKVLGATEPQRPPLVVPGETVEIDTPFPRRLNTGEYTLLTRVDYGTALPIEHETTFQIGTPAPAPNPAWGDAPARAPSPSPFGDRWWLAIGGILALLGLAAGAARLATRRAPGPVTQRVVLMAPADATTEALVDRLRKAGLAAASATSSTVALEQIAQEHPDTVVLDGRLPGRELFELYGAVRSSLSGAALPILTINYTGNANALGTVDDLDAYLGPTTSPDEVVRVLRGARSGQGVAWRRSPSPA